MIAIADLRAVLDSIAAGVTVFNVAMGEQTVGTVSGGAKNNADFLATINDVTVQRDLTGLFAIRADAVRASLMHRTLQGFMVQRALDRHLGATYGSLSAFLRANNTRVHENLLLIGLALDADVVFGATSIQLAEWVGAAFVDGGAIDTAQRADQAVELVTVDKAGATAGQLNVTLRNRDGQEQTANLPIAGGTVDGTVTPILAGTRWADVTAITYDNGNAGDHFRVRTIVERDVVL
jgi:hypothetical protein